MGCFGYLCSVCEEQIVGDCFSGGEHSVLIHKRHGKEIGRTVGHYNEYGSVIEDKLFRSSDDEMGEHPNSHDEICTSEMTLDDSTSFGGRKLYRGKSIPVSFMRYRYQSEVAMKMNEGKSLLADDRVWEEDILARWEEDGHEEKYKAFLDTLEDVEPQSGIIACHKVCYDGLTPEEQENLPFSKDDPNQSWGEINPKFA